MFALLVHSPTQNILLYTERYEEEFQPYLQGFVSEIWKLETSPSLINEPENDKVRSLGLSICYARHCAHTHRQMDRQHAKHIIRDNSCASAFRGFASVAMCGFHFSTTHHHRVLQPIRMAENSLLGSFLCKC